MTDPQNTENTPMSSPALEILQEAIAQAYGGAQKSRASAEQGNNLSRRLS